MIVIYVENMLKLESGELGELVRNSMLTALVDRLIDLDVSQMKLPCKTVVGTCFLLLYVRSYVLELLIGGDWMG